MGVYYANNFDHHSQPATAYVLDPATSCLGSLDRPLAVSRACSERGDIGCKASQYPRAH